MNISNRIFTYPVLNEDRDDYKTSSFNVEYKLDNSNINNIHLSFIFDLNCPDIQKLVDENKAKFVIHLECTTTSYRIVKDARFNSIDAYIPYDKINGKLEICAFIVTSEDIFEYYSSDFDDDYNGIKFNIDKYSLLAYKNISSFEIKKKMYEFDKGDSIFTIYKKITEEDQPMDIELESDKIKIGLGQSEYGLYQNIFSKPGYQKVFNAMTIFPALVYVFEQLLVDGNIDMYKYKTWYKSLVNTFKSRGLDFEEILLDGDTTSFILAQKVMELPLLNAMEEVKNIDNSKGGF